MDIVRRTALRRREILRLAAAGAIGVAQTPSTDSDRLYVALRVKELEFIDHCRVHGFCGPSWPAKP